MGPGGRSFSPSRRRRRLKVAAVGVAAVRRQLRRLPRRRPEEARKALWRKEADQVAHLGKMLGRDRIGPLGAAPQNPVDVLRIGGQAPHLLGEAARDLGAPWWKIHRDVVIPYAKPGIASGCTMVFMLSAGSLAAPLFLGGPNTLWFTAIVYDFFFQAFNWPRGAAYAFILLAACIAFVMLMLQIGRAHV